MFLLQTLPLLAILPLSLAKVISVDVGKSGLTFSPDTITAEKGDSIEFTFYPQSHTVVESTFDKPCNYKSGGISSGDGFSTSNGPSSKIFTVNIDNTDTRWLYCSVGGHCQQGMSLVINPGSQSLKDYKSASGSIATTANPNSVSGGSVSDKSASSSGSSSVTAKATSASSSSASNASSSSGSAASVTSSSSASKASATSATSAASASATGGASKVGAGAALGVVGMLLGGLI